MTRVIRSSLAKHDGGAVGERWRRNDLIFRAGQPARGSPVRAASRSNPPPTPKRGLAAPRQPRRAFSKNSAALGVQFKDSVSPGIGEARPGAGHRWPRSGDPRGDGPFVLPCYDYQWHPITGDPGCSSDQSWCGIAITNFLISRLNSCVFPGNCRFPKAPNVCCSKR